MLCRNVVGAGAFKGNIYKWRHAVEGVGGHFYETICDDKKPIFAWQGSSIYDVISEWPLNCLDVLINGTASEVLGMDSETVFKNTVRDSRIVTSVKIHEG